jgi:hypothetical protein
MTTVGKYCKAYSLKKLRKYKGWKEAAENARKEEKEGDGEEQVPRELTDDDFLYLQENYVVTDGIFKDENIIFDDVTDEWISYCQDKLEFEIPEFARATEEEEQEQEEQEQGG